MDNTVQGQMKKDLLRKPCTLPEIRRPLAEKAVFLVDSRRKARSEPSLHYCTGEQLVRCCAVLRSSENEPHPVAALQRALGFGNTGAGAVRSRTSLSDKREGLDEHRIARLVVSSLHV